MNLVRTFLLVTVVSLLIWTFAEGQSLQTERVTAEIDFGSDQSTTHTVAVLDDTWQSRAEIQLEGSASRLDDLDAVMRGRLAIIPGMEGLPRTDGEHTVDLQRALRDHPQIQSRGVTVLAVTPPTVRVRVNELTTVRLPVRVEAPSGELEGVATPAIAEVEVRLPSQAAAALPESAAVIARIRPADLAGLQVGRRETLRGVRLEPGPELGALESVRLLRDRVDIALTVRSKTATTIIPSVPVFLVISPDEMDRWEVEIPLEEQSLRNVRVTGPSEVIGRIEDPTTSGLRVRAYVRLSFEDLEGRIQSKRAEFSDLPTQLSFEVEDQEVSLTIRPRGSDPEDEQAPSAASE